MAGLNFLSEFIECYKDHIIIFLIAFFLISAVSLPKIYVTDEWISANQLSQMDRGHQVEFSEGKYGAFENGAPFAYFSEKHNRLGYTIFLPLLSLPVLKIIHVFGDFFLYFFLVFWSGILVAAAYLLHYYFPDLQKKGSVNLPNVLILSAVLLFIVNIATFKTFPLVGSAEHSEVAAIGLTNLILLSLLIVILYSIYVTIFADRKFSIVATITSICCSSYLFWATTLKDHVLVALLVTLILFFGIKAIYNRDLWFIPSLFLVIGLIAWARAEIAVPLFVMFFISVIFYTFFYHSQKMEWKTKLFLCLSPVFTILGAIPFFINNYMLTHNPLIPAFTFYSESLTPVVVNSSLPVAISSDSMVTISDTVPNSLFHFVDILSYYYPYQSGIPANSIIHLLFLPRLQTIGLCVICPLAVIGVLLLVLSGKKRLSFSQNEKYLVLLLVLISGCLFVAYLKSLPYMHLSPGITPDIRYLSPLYLTMSIFGILCIQKAIGIPRMLKNYLTVFAVILLEIVGILAIIMVFFRPHDNSVDPILTIITVTITCVVYGLTLLCLCWSLLFRNHELRSHLCFIILAALIAAPFIWQIAMVFLSRMILETEGYTYWIPLTKEIMQQIQLIIFTRP
jgi:hypothetical protein